MEIIKTVTEAIKTSDGQTLTSGDKIIFRVGSVDRIGYFKGIEKGKIKVANLTNNTEYNMQPKTIDKIYKVSAEIIEREEV